MAKPALAVLGMHRSYTSLAARWLAECGIDMGEKTLSGGIGNEDGHFEDVEFLGFHTKVLVEHGLPSNGMAELSGPDFDAEAYRALSIKGPLWDEGKALAERKASHGLPFGWKEPRTCLFMPFYREVLDPFALILFRPFQQVVASLLSREKRVLLERVYPTWRRSLYWVKRSRWDERFEQLRESYFEAWAFYNKRLLDYIDKCDPDRCMVHDLGSLISQDRAIIAKLHSWGFSCQYNSIAALVRETEARDVMGFSEDQIERGEQIASRFEQLIER